MGGCLTWFLLFAVVALVIYFGPYLLAGLAIFLIFKLMASGAIPKWMEKRKWAAYSKKHQSAESIRYKKFKDNTTGGADEEALYKFKNNPRYRKRVLKKLRKQDEKDRAHLEKALEKEREYLEYSRSTQFAIVDKDKWERILLSDAYVNKTEGKIKIGETVRPWSAILGASINVRYGTETDTREIGKTYTSEFKPSVAGTVTGTMLGGFTGAVIGGLGFGKIKTTEHPITVATSKNVCKHLGVIVNLGGIEREIVLSKYGMDCSSSTYSNEMHRAKKIIERLEEYSKTPVPEKPHTSNEDPSIVSIDRLIKKNKEELSALRREGSQFKIPNKYRDPNTLYLSDEEYLESLEKARL